MKIKRCSRALLWAALCLTMILCLGLFCACDGDKTPDDTDNGTTASTDAVTSAADVTAEPTEEVTEADTDAATEGATDEAATEAVTEEVTEEPTAAETLPADKPTDAAVLTFCDTPLNATFITPNIAATYEVVQDDEQGSVLKLTVADTQRIGDPYVTIDYAAYMAAAGLDPVAWNDCGVALVLLKVESATNNKLEMAAYNKSGEKSKTIRTSGTYKTGDSGWQYVLLPLVEEAYDGTLTEIRFDFVDKPKAAGETVYLKSISFVKDKATALKMMGTSLITPSTATVVIPGLTKEYKFVQISDSHVSAFSDDDQKKWTAARIQYNTARRNSFMADGLFAEERFPLLFDYANEIQADGLFLTGDLIDFPSEKNVALLYENVSRFNGKSIYCLGNHDWNYSDDYMTGNAVTTNRPLFNDLTNGDPYLSYVEYDEFIVVAVDNSSDVVTDDTVDKFLALYEKNKPIILLLHVPLHVDTLAPDCIKVWGRNIAMGPGALGGDWGSVQRFYNAVAVDENSPVVAVFSGHVHFNHEDVLPNGVPQYITSTGYTGDLRVVTVKGEN
ncbi:MAG: metallophosphoesterase [Clostridia bacterium]|nr:metallophosphoesterase [Clostridia bacterium]